MKKLVVILLLVLLATNVFAGGPIDIDGYDWVAFSYDEKVAFVLGALAGVCYANKVLIGYAADGITLASMEHVDLIVGTLDRAYETTDLRLQSVSVMEAIAAVWVVIRGG